ncbi:MAG: hypothetical protein ACOYKM_05235 [Caulobacterales bacterium]|jgi:hypothetical protein
MAITDPKAIVADYAGRARTLVSAIVASWPALAVSALCVIAFASSVLHAPDRLPPFGSISAAQLGLPLGLPDLDEVGTQAQEAAQAAKPHVQDAVARLQAEHPGWVRWLNLSGLIFSTAMLIMTMALQVQQFRRSV